MEDIKQLQSQNNRLNLEIRQVKLEKQHLQRSNQYYVAQVSQMEVKISELKAYSSSQDNEISELRSCLQELESKLQNEQKGSDEVFLLKEENEYLKGLMQEQGNLSELKIQLEHAMSMKQTFEQKYRETKTELIQHQHSQSEDFIHKIDEAENLKKHFIPKLYEELENLTHQKFELESQVEYLTEICKEMQLELRAKDESKLALRIPDLHIRTDQAPETKTTTRTPSEASTTNKQQKTQKKIEKPPKNLGSNKVAEYVPSFMRAQKNPSKKSTPEVHLDLDESDSDH